MLVDTHCHLDYYTAEELPLILARAAEAGVGEMVTIGTRLAQSETVRLLAESLPNVWSTVGIHPHSAAEEAIPDPHAIVAMTAHDRVIGIGEAGLDYFYDKSPRDVQRACFRAHIHAAQMAGLPLCIHARDADDDMADILGEEMARAKFDFLLHCFSSTPALGRAALALGGYLSFSGIVTFPKSEELREFAREVPAERLLVETDAPYLAPVPHRGKRNEPSYVPRTAAVLAGVRGMEVSELAALTTANFRTLFAKARPAA